MQVSLWFHFILAYASSHVDFSDIGFGVVRRFLILSSTYNEEEQIIAEQDYCRQGW